MQLAGQPNPTLKQWTGQDSAPVAVLNDERPRAHWSEILMLAERLAPEPSLIPLDEDERVLMFGLCHELCGEDGFGWNVRLLLLDGLDRIGSSMASLIRSKYMSEFSAKHSRARFNAIIGSLAHRLAAQAAKGSIYLIGDKLSAADIYWTAFSNFLHSMPPNICPMPAVYRSYPEACATFLDKPAPQILLNHRDQILALHFKTPLRL